MEISPEFLEKSLYQAIQDESNYSPRSEQGREFKAGISDLGFCSERTRRMLDRQVPYDTDVLAAWIGTALGDYAERAAKRVWPNATVQAEVFLDLTGESRVYSLTGHPDIILGSEGVLIDIKTAFGLTTVRRTGPSLSQQFQRHCYAKAAWEMGHFGTRELADVQVANIWIDRSAQDKELHCQMEPFNEEYVWHAAQWLDDVVYAYLQGEEARKEPPREMCAKACGFFDVCRAHDTDVEGLITDKVALTAAEMYREGARLKAQGDRLQKDAKQHLIGVQGSTGDLLIRWTHINETEVPASFRKGYDKLEVRPLPKRKAQS